MTSIVPKRTPRSRADWHLSNLVLEGGKSKRPDGKYISRDEKGGWEVKTVNKPSASPPQGKRKK
jgi:hypothetical protein